MITSMPVSIVFISINMRVVVSDVPVVMMFISMFVHSVGVSVSIASFVS